jgi:hypothetical protein
MKIEQLEEMTEKLGADQFLEVWVSDHIHSLFAFEQEVDDRYWECVAAADEEGISEQELAKAAGGDLHEFVRKALRDASIDRLIYHSTPVRSAPPEV